LKVSKLCPTQAPPSYDDVILFMCSVSLSTYPKKLKDFLYICHFGVFLDKKNWFEKLGILVMIQCTIRNLQGGLVTNP
jgi:hypothetical protein